MDRLDVERGDYVNKGDRIGLVSNDFGGSPTTIHLHFDVKMNILGEGFRYVSPYTSLVHAYESLIGANGQLIDEKLIDEKSNQG
jgi:murein DD-endopeptidase MepM/ murein hydrolase activator NlpD